MSEKITVYIDGASRGNPGEGAVAFVVYNSNSRELYRGGKKIGRCTNNMAEYIALIEALKYLNGLNGSGKKSVSIYSDSELVVNQINGTYQVRNQRLKKLYDEVMKLIDQSGHNINLKIIPRDYNREADRLVNLILDNKL